MRILPENTPVTRQEIIEKDGAKQTAKFAPIVPYEAVLKIKRPALDEDGNQITRKNGGIVKISEVVPLSLDDYLDALNQHEPDNGVTVSFQISWKTKAINGDLLLINSYLNGTNGYTLTTVYALCEVLGLIEETATESFESALDSFEDAFKDDFDISEIDLSGDVSDSKHKKLAERLFNLHSAINEAAAKSKPEVIYKGLVYTSDVLKSYQVDAEKVEVLKRL